MAELNENNVPIRDVWDENLDAEFRIIVQKINNYPYVAMDTEFPGTMHILKNRYKRSTEEKYRNMKQNVDACKLIQLGLTLLDEKGNLPRCNTIKKYIVWQFNFCESNPKSDNHAPSSVKFLRESGIEFDMFLRKGVQVLKFAEKMIPSGLVMNDSVKWITFHGNNDFGFLVKALRDSKLLNTLKEFNDRLKMFFIAYYDINHLRGFCDCHAIRFGGLNNIARELGVQRIGRGHHGGSDSLLTSRVFFTLKQYFFKSRIPDSHVNQLKWM